MRTVFASFVFLAQLGVATLPVHAEPVSYRLCIGEFVSKCPVAADSFYACYTEPQAAAADMCTVYRKGQRQSVDFRLRKQGFHGGNHCGYEWYQVTCMF